MLAGSVVLTVIVLVPFALVAMRPGSLGSPTPRVWIVGGGLILPALVLTPLLAWALIAGERMQPRGDALRVEAVAEQWRWTFRLPEMGVETQNVLHLPAGQPVEIALTSRDVIHGFWIPQLAGKLDAIPGRTTVLRLTADTPGTHEGVCAEFCGLEHAHMRFAVVVHPADEFEEALAGEPAVGAAE
jgi:cytochrome c oxidase subunit 2